MKFLSKGPESTGSTVDAAGEKRYQVMERPTRVVVLGEETTEPVATQTDPSMPEAMEYEIPVRSQSTGLTIDAAGKERYQVMERPTGVVVLGEGPQNR